MAGMVGTYQGLVLRSVTFTRSRGWGADTSVVEAIVPGGFDVKAPELDSVTRAIDKPDMGAVEVDSAPPVAGREATLDPSANKLEPAGYLVMAESIDGLEAQESQTERGPWKHPPVLLFVRNVDEVKVSTGGLEGTTGAGPRIVRIELVDERYFWPRGLVGKWSFNRKLGNGKPALDSHKPGSTSDNPLPYTRREVANLCTLAFPRSPELAAAPAEWENFKAPIELPRWGRAADCLAQLARGSGLEDPCLRLDGKVALHVPGDGMLGYAPNGEGANSEEIPASLIEWKDGGGDGRVSEPSWPEPYALVVGGERIATVAVDDAEPVLMLPPDNRIVPLSEKNVRTLTNNAYGLDWLARFVLRPSAYQSNVNLDPETAALFADQAWKLYRLRDAVKRTDGEVVDEPGPNAHLLPLRDRAETDSSGRRLPPQVETYRFVPVHHALKGNPTLGRLNEVRRLASEVRETITPEVAAGKKKPSNGSVLSTLDAKDVGSIFGHSGLVSLEEFQDALNRAREMDQWRGTPNGDAISESLKTLALEQLQIEEEAGGFSGRDELLLAAYEVLEVEAQLEDTDAATGPIDSGDPFRLSKALQDPANRAIKDALAAKLKALSEKIASEREEKRTREEETGLAFGVAASEEVGLVRYRNQRRKVDAGAQVVSEAAGVIRTSDLAGLVTPDGVGDLSRASFVPAPVRFVFGATLRPRVDVPPTPEGGTPTSDPTAGPPADDSANDLGAQAATGGANVIPSVLSDRESYYVSGWERTGRGVATPKPVEGVDGVPLSQAVRLEGPDLVELVTIDGKSNRGKLDDEAQAMAREAFSAPDVVRSRRLMVGHLWPVQCDGIVRAVEIRTRFENGVPCGYETLIATGGSTAPVPAQVGNTVVGRNRGRATREGLLG